MFVAPPPRHSQRPRAPNKYRNLHASSRPRKQRQSKLRSDLWAVVRILDYRFGLQGETRYLLQWVGVNRRTVVFSLKSCANKVLHKERVSACENTTSDLAGL
jgi:hypothetical protein